MSPQPNSYLSLYQYDSYNRLKSADTDGSVTAYTYDGNNLRQSKTTNGITTQHIWDGSDMVMDGTNKFYRGATGIEFATLNGNTSFYHKDAHGDVTALTDSAGAITQSYIYDAFGNQLNENENENDNNPFRYCGEYVDSETGLTYLRNRYYDNAIGRFITEDPIKDGLNWYVYCGNNPVMFEDPFGESATAAFIIGCTVVSAAGSAFAQLSVNYATGQSWHEGLLTSTVSGALSGLTFATTLDPSKAAIVGTVVSTTGNMIEGIYDGKSTTDIAIGAVEDIAWGFAGYKIGKITGVFLKTNTNPGWIQPKKLASFFSKSYGKKIIKQTLAEGAITAVTVSMYENGKRNIQGIQELVGVDADGIYGTETKEAVREFQQELINGGYLPSGGADGIWGKNTDAAFREYVKDTAIFISGN